MPKFFSGRKPRPIQEDSISCPAALHYDDQQIDDMNCSRTSLMLEQLSDIEEGSERNSKSTSSKATSISSTSKNKPSLAAYLREQRNKEAESSKRRKEKRRERAKGEAANIEAVKRGERAAATREKKKPMKYVQHEVRKNHQKIKNRVHPPRRLPPSSIVSLESASVSTFNSLAGSVYTTATIIVRRPAWGHYIVAIIIFTGWILHHHLYSQNFQPILAASKPIEKMPIRQQETPADGKTAVYLTQDYEKRTDYTPIRSVSGAFSTLDGEIHIPKSVLKKDFEPEQQAMPEGETMSALELATVAANYRSGDVMSTSSDTTSASNSTVTEEPAEPT